MRSLFRTIRDLAGFSLVELMIVIVVIGVLAAIAIPIYTNNITQARMCEADANLSSIRTQLRIYSSANGEFPTTNPAGYVIGANWNDIKDGEMTGKYFSDSSYTYLCANGLNFTITCDAGDILNSHRTLDQFGTLDGGL